METISPTGKFDSRRIGPYKLLQQIGEGGMGSVWMAEQEEPVRRRVALKLIRGDFGTKEAIARFEAERQALAMMNHQNIAKVLDAGTTDNGSPYFVMELVKGIPLTEYCDQNKLTIEERLELFIPVCRAIQHAHQKGIIHRDLKPSNVLVTLYDGKPVPKVIDFGLAKALEHTTKLTDKTMFTEFGKVVGTVQYMAPEQAEMNALDVDTRTDIYSLGVMLYELLTGSTPLDKETVNKKALLQVLAIIREKDPPRPSTRLSTTGDAVTGLSEQRKIAPAKLHQILKGELDWIVMKALEKDRTRRYETASSLADDVGRYLNSEVVQARPPSLAYRLKKRVLRLYNNPVAVSLTAVLATVIVATLAVLLIVRQSRINRDNSELVKGLVQQIETAQMGNVPEIIEQLEPIRSWADPQLKLEFDRVEKPESKLKLALAMLPNEEFVLDYIISQLPVCDGAQLEVILPLISEHSELVSKALWQLAPNALIDQDINLLPIAAVLSQFDPRSHQWPGLADTITERLLQESSLRRSKWIELLFPVREYLVNSLVEIYRDQNSSRQMVDLATDILEVYAADNLEVLAQLILTSKPKQFNQLFDEFAAHGEAANEILHDELKREASPKWNDDVEYQDLNGVPPDLINEIEKSAGIVSPHFAVCYALPLERFEPIATQLEKFGFRPTRLRPYWDQDSVSAAIVWKRDGRKWRYATDAKQNKIGQLDQTNIKDHFCIVDVAGYVTQRDGKSVDRFAGLWVEKQVGVESPYASDDSSQDSGVMLNVQKKDFVTAIRNLESKGGFRFLSNIHSYLSSDETIRHSAIFNKESRVATYDLNRMSALRNDNYLQKAIWDIAAFPRAKAELPWPSYSSIWANDIRVESKIIRGSDFRNVSNSGFRPQSASAWSHVLGDRKLVIGVSAWHRPKVPESEKEELAYRQAISAVSLLKTGDNSTFWNQLESQPDPRKASWIMHLLGQLEVDPGLVLEEFFQRSFQEVDYQLLICVGKVIPRAGKDERQKVITRVLDLYRSHSDPAIHSACFWLINNCTQQADQLKKIDKEFATGARVGNRDWYVTKTLNNTMICFDEPQAFVMGEPFFNDNDEYCHRVTLPNEFAVGSTEVTVTQYNEFIKQRPQFRTKWDRREQYGLTCPRHIVSWYQAAAFCNWLSEQEGIPKDQWCYPDEIMEAERINKDGLTLPSDHLKRTGYRLPTEAEWEYACRAGTTTTFYFGGVGKNSEQEFKLSGHPLLGEYCWYDGNSGGRTRPVAKRLPNQFGLFDLYGNVLEWCIGSSKTFGYGRETVSEIKPLTQVPYRGGSYDSYADSVRSAGRFRDYPYDSWSTFGFRIARTIKNENSSEKQEAQK